MFKISPKANENYLTKIVKITNVVKHPQADRLQMTTIQGNTVITGTDLKVGDVVVFFPLESSINNKFLADTNSFEDKTLNSDTEKKGFFQKSGRVRATRLRGVLSQGYIVPINTFLEWLSKTTNTNITFNESMLDKEFDMFGDIQISKKHVNIQQAREERTAKQKANKKVQVQSRLVENQFRLHEDTAQLGRNLFKIQPDSLISITAKQHGTSGSFSKVLTKKKLKWYETFATKLGIKVQDTVYDSVYSSRKVIKNRNFNDKPISDGYYGKDIWGVVAKELDDYIKPTMTIYGEIIGYIDQGKMVQKGYDYGCQPGEHKFNAYRITTTTPDGNVIEWSAKQVQDYCKSTGLGVVPELYYGYAKDLYPISDNQTKEQWQDEFFQYLKEHYLEKDDPLCKNQVPDEGIVLRVEDLTLKVFKLKSDRFYLRETKELDKGEINIEDEQSQGEE